MRSGTVTMPPPAIALEGVGQGTAQQLTAEASTPPPPPAASSPWSKELRCGIARIDWALLLVALAALAVTLRRPFTLAFLHVPCDLQEFHAAREDQHRKKKRLGAARAEFLNVRLKLSKKLLSSSLGSAVWRVRSSEGRRRSSTRSDERETAAEPSEGRRTSRRRTSRASRSSESGGGSHWSLRVSTPRAGGPSGALPPPSPRSASLPPMATIRSSVVADSL